MMVPEEKMAMLRSIGATSKRQSESVVPQVMIKHADIREHDQQRT